MTDKRVYIAIDLKSFFASVECVERGLDPLTAKLVVADESRTQKTICLAVTPSLKAYGIPGRARLFEVEQRLRRVRENVEYIIAPPRMALYQEYSTRIYEVYLKYVAPEDIHVYSIDEVMMDVSAYLRTARMTPREFAVTIIRDVYQTTGITATAGIGTNLYLCKIAMDIVAKHVEADEMGVRIAELDEMSYRRLLWTHRPLTDFWRVGPGYARKLEANGLYNMGDIARCSLGKESEYYNEDLLYDLFGVNAELLIDHAWGYEPCRMEDIKAYRPATNSISSGQVLQCAYDYEKTRLIVKEMADQLALNLAEKKLVTDQLVLTIGYDVENLTDAGRRSRYQGEITTDRYGRKVPKHAHGTINMDIATASTHEIMEAMVTLYDRIIDRNLLVRRITLTANHVVDEKQAEEQGAYHQMNLFTDYGQETEDAGTDKNRQEREKNLQKAVLDLKKKYGKNAILKGMNLEEGATAVSRNSQIGGHKA